MIKRTINIGSAMFCYKLYSEKPPNADRRRITVFSIPKQILIWSYGRRKYFLIYLPFYFLRYLLKYGFVLCIIPLKGKRKTVISFEQSEWNVKNSVLKCNFILKITVYVLI